VAGVGEQPLAAEIGAPAHPGPVLAVRGNQVWEPHLVPCARNEFSAPLPRPDDRYLITGDLDAALGLARALTDTGLQPDFVFLSTEGEPDRRQLAAIRAAGAQVVVAAGDLTAASLASTAADHGPLHGVLHVAGRGPSDDPLAATRFAADVAMVLGEFAADIPSIRFLVWIFDDPDPGAAFATAATRLANSAGHTTALAVELSTPPDDHVFAAVVRRLREDVEPHIVVAGQRNGAPAQPAAARGNTGPVDPPNELTETIRTTWAETLGLPDLAQDTDFFAVGGDSLTAVQVVSRLRTRLGVDLGVVDLAEAPTARELAVMISARLG